MKSYRDFLKELEMANFINDYVKVPRQLLIDPNLTDRQKIAWMLYSSFQYKSTSDIFPGRKKIAKILGLKNICNVSALTGKLQDKGYMKKFSYKDNTTYYELFFDDNVDESVCLRDRDWKLIPSKRNKPKNIHPP